jgi:disulfide bond formation protein DsbB
MVYYRFVVLTKIVYLLIIEFMGNIKGKLFMLVFIFTSLILGMGVWNNYRPQVIYASCTDIAQKTTDVIVRKEIENINEQHTFDVELNNCLSDAGYFNNK